MHYALHVSEPLLPGNNRAPVSDIVSHVKMCQKPQQKPSKAPGNEPETFKDEGHGAKICNRHKNKIHGE